jgi:DNA-binding PadR family transcriptional regulator
MFRYLVLGLLRSGAPLHGYALIKAYRERSGIMISNGNFYRELRGLVREGLVRTATNPEGADERRAPYEITETGAEVCDEWLATPGNAVCAQYDDDLSLRGLFLGDVERDVARQMLDSWRDELWLKGKLLERERQGALQRPGDGHLDALGMLLTRRLKHIAADLEFLEDLRMAHEASLSVSGTGRRAAPARGRRRSPRVTARRRP